MKLVDILKYLKTGETINQIYVDHNLNTGSEAVLVYIKDAVDLNSEIVFFDIEETDDNLKFKKEGVEYFALFTLHHGVDIYSYFEEFFADEKYTEQQQAQRLLEYVINDA